jgi:hypothetical protein
MDNKKQYHSVKGKADLENYNDGPNRRLADTQALIITLLAGAVISGLLYFLYGAEFYREFLGY